MDHERKRPLRHEVTLAGVWDTEAPTILTSQRDVTSEVCGVTSTCVEASKSDQAEVFRYASGRDASKEKIETDIQVREIFIIHWTADVSAEDKSFVQDLLESSANISDE
ncbi:hypothetical protein [Pseudoclavibacter sp. RFBA6]|uniref:hypothetical protein n=1 Tax=Pseudoclavibacter sp. RFBA6 TaxID=2080573 RepID=UPI000CE7753A|nr:hypothetical protein [Pseudoclavibacter sp. RFBA6]PPG38735.1 hypothetical protein C5C17_13675 [Pseudoclavibacter sp. RFBA6]